MKERVCPLCGMTYNVRPAVSRADGALICPDCGIRESLRSVGIEDPKEQEQVMGLMRQYEADRTEKDL